VSHVVAEKHALKHWWIHFTRHYPARLAIGVFAGSALFFTFLLSLPFATVSRAPARFTTALFTAVSALCITGLTVVDTATFWSFFGQVVILVAVMLGGLGIITAAAIMGLTVSRHLGLTQRMLMASETKSQGLGGVRSLIRIIVITSLVCEALVALVLLPRMLFLHDNPARALWYSIFLGVSAFNNAGFVPMPEGLTPYVSDWLVCVPLMLGVIIGSLGFPVIKTLRVAQKNHLGIWRRWSLHAKLTIVGSLALLVIGFVAFLALEYHDPNTLAPLNFHTKILASLFAAVMPRSGGFTTLPAGGYTPAMRLTSEVLMFIGGGSAGTGGGIKITTLLVLLLAIRAEARGDRDVEAFHRRIPTAAVRVAIAVFAGGLTIVLVATALLLWLTNTTLDLALFEVISAFATCGLEGGLSAKLNVPGRILIILLMFIGRAGSMTFGAALAFRDRQRVIRYPEERPLIG
jgi:Trk-type K+ transport system membrane component